MALDTDDGSGPPDDEIFRRLMPSGGGAPDAAQPGAGVADTPAALAPLQVSPADLRAAGSAADGLGTRTTTARARLTHAHDGLARAARGFTFTAAVTALHTSWSDRLTAIGTDCAEIDSLCQDAAKTHGSNDSAVVDTMRSPV